MEKMSFKSLVSAFAIAFFLWCVSCEVCSAREVTDRRSSKATAPATEDDSAARSSLWLWGGPWRIPYFPFPPFPYHHPWPYLPPPHWPFWPRPYPTPNLPPAPPCTPTTEPTPPPPPQTPIAKPAPPPAPTAQPTPTPAPPTSPAEPTPPASPTAPAVPTPSTSPTPPAAPTPPPSTVPPTPPPSTMPPTPPASPTPPAVPTPPPSPTPPAVPTPPASPPPPTPPASPTPPAVPTPPASPTPPAMPTPPAAPTPPVPSNSTTFNVLDFGAKGDGSTDDTKAFQDAWAASCNVEASTMVVPAKYVFLVGPISFVGEHCQENITLQLDGTIVAPTDPQAWGDGGPETWLHFEKLSRFTLQGSGTVDGRGSVWWQRSQSEDLDGDLYDVDDDDHADHEMDYEEADIQAKEELNSMPRKKPTAMKFHHCLNVAFSGIKIQNSPNFHLTFHDCVGVLVHDMSISSPGDSPNTDGIHLGNSQDVTIHDATLACGDDCISIVSGCSNIHIHNVNCGPGHGISIGSLGKGHSKACVHNVTVQDINLQGTTNGVRIKSWQGGSGAVYGVKFSNIRVSEVRWPIIIDQYYCDHATCTNQSSAVAIRSIAYENVVGTYTERPVDLACSDSVPCEDITLSGINLRPSSQNPPSHDDGPFCWQTFGQLTTPISPPINCVQTGTSSSNGVWTGQDSC